ncbi:MAG TPA: ABC transporter ATP-binding protein [Nitriliruptorales bacterium]|nr:ABC transporter ATP-binding protein [Nitriliruptorales bacterium]
MAETTDRARSSGDGRRTWQTPQPTPTAPRTAAVDERAITSANQWNDLDPDMIPPPDYDKTRDPVWPGNTRVENPAISVRNLSKAFGDHQVLEDISLDFPRGKITIVLGPSGTGKSVFLRHLIGLLKPDRGEVWVHGRNIPQLRRKELYEVRRTMGVLFQDGALFGSMNVFDNVAFPLREHTGRSEREIRRIVEAKLEMVGLEGAKNKLPGEISGGMRKRAGLARALVLDPEIVLFDEPDSGLDPVRTAILNDLILELNEEIGSTFVIVTHDIRTARGIGDYVGLLFRRNLVAYGTKHDMFDSQYPVVRQFLGGRTSGPIGMSNERDRPELL